MFDNNCFWQTCKLRSTNAKVFCQNQSGIWPKHVFVFTQDLSSTGPKTEVYQYSWKIVLNSLFCKLWQFNIFDPKIVSLIKIQ